MKYYFAPLEGITYYNFRQAHHQFFPGIDAYYTPFVVATWTHKMKSREKRDILPENNAGVPVVPQILTNKADEFLFCAKYMADFGYTEVNLNAGCPVGTVTSKGKGSGLLKDPETLDAFLDGVFSGIEEEKIPVSVSVKTRLGWENPDEFERILEIYQRYPISRLIIHARTRQELYSGAPEIEAFAKAYEKICGDETIRGAERGAEAERIAEEKRGAEAERIAETGHGAEAKRGEETERGAKAKCGAETECVAEARYKANTECGRMQLCYNGNVATPEDAEKIGKRFPKLDAVMIGRGLLGHPGLVTEIRTGKETDIATIRGFHDELYGRYAEQFQDDRILVNHMKELWTYLGDSFPGSRDYVKAIHKARNRREYETAVRILFSNASK